MTNGFQFLIPEKLSELISKGIWPKDQPTALRQNLHPILSKSAVQKFAPEEYTIFFYPPPFATVRACMKSEKFWSGPHSAVTEIDPDNTVLIGDFGPGSDAPFALDYRKAKNDPAVIRLKWAKDGNHWVEMAPDFSIFATFISQ